jgi:hypothetical protein
VAERGSPGPDSFIPTRSRCQQPHVAAPVRQVLAEAAAACNAAAATLWVVSPDGLHMEGAVSTDAQAHVLESATVPVADSVVGMIAATGLGTTIGPQDPHNPSVDRQTGVPTTTMAAVPVYVGGALCGVVSAVNRRDRALFNRLDLQVLESKAEQLGMLLKSCGNEDFRG